MSIAQRILHVFRRRPSTRRRSRWRLVRRGVILPAVVLLIAYLAIPWWLPTNWLRGQIIAQLQHDLARPVSIKGIEVSWRDGVVLHDLRIYQTDEFGPGDPLLQVEQVSVPLTPIRTLTQRRLGRLHVRDAQLSVVRNKDGVLNLSELKPFNTAPAVKIDEICCEGTKVLLINHRSKYSAQIRLGTLDCKLDPVIRAAVSGQGAFLNEKFAGRSEPIGDFSVSAHALDPFISDSGAAAGPRQGGQMHLSWRTVNLASLPLNDFAALQKFGLNDWRGQCNGEFDMELRADGRLNWRLSMKLSQLDLSLSAAPRGLHVPAATLELAGKYDLATLSVDKLSVEFPGLEMQANAQVRPADAGYFGLEIERARIDPVRLREVAPDLLDWLRPQWQLAGTMTVSGGVEWSETRRHVELSLDGTDLNVASDWLTKPPGVPARVTVDGTYRQDVDRLDVKAISLRLGGSEVSLDSSSDELFNIFTGRKKVWDVWLGWYGRLLVKTDDATELLRYVPALRRAIGQTRIAGPAEFLFRFQPIDRQVPLGAPRVVDARQLTIRMTLPRDAQFMLPGAPGQPALLDKPAGEPLTVLLESTFDPADPTVRTGRLIVRRGEEGDEAALDDTAGPAVLAINPFSGKLAFSYPPDTPADSRAKPEMDVVVDGELIGRRLEHLLDLSPVLRERLAAQHVQVAGGLGGEVNLRLGPGQLRARLAVELTKMKLDVAATEQLLAASGVTLSPGEKMPPGLQKRVGDPATIIASLKAFPDYREEQFEFDGLGLKLLAQRTVEGSSLPREQRDVSLAVRSVEALLGHAPLLARRLAQDGLGLRGGATAKMSWTPGADHWFALAIDATDLDIRPLSAPDSKPAGMPLSLTAEWTTNLPNEPVHPWVKLDSARLTVAGSAIDLSGSCVLLPVFWDDPKTPPAERFGSLIRRSPPLDRLDVDIHGRLALDPAIRKALPAVDRLVRQFGLEGAADLSARVTGGWEQLRVQAELDGRDMSIRRPGVLIKKAGVPAAVAVDATGSPWLEVLRVDRLTGQLNDMTFSGTGLVHRRPGAATPQNYDLTLAVDVPELARLAEACPAVLSQPELVSEPLSGRVSGEIHLVAEDPRLGEPGEATVAHPRLLPSRLELADVRCTLAGTPIAATGRIDVSQRMLSIPGLTVQVGGTKAALVAQINDPMGRPRGWLDIVGERLDVDQLGKLWERLQAVPVPQRAADRLPPGEADAMRRAGQLAVDMSARAFEGVSEPVGPPLLGQPTTAPAVGPARPPAAPGTDARAARKIIDFLARCDIAGKVHFGDVVVSDAKNQTRYKLLEFRSSFTVDGGKIDFPFKTVMEGGLLAGKVSSNLSDEMPMLSVTYDADRLFPTKNVQPIVEAFFPGMTIYGHVTMREANQQKLLPRPGEANWTTGRGEIVFEDGLLVGQAGPDWMARIFPGLKLTQYRFKQMHNWFTLTEDGKANHHMIFEGQNYDVYMIGYTHRGTGQARYTVGVDLLASLDSKTWSVDLRQGKIPLMYVSGRIENRELKDASFTMVPPPIALFQMLFRDNLLYRGVIERAIRRGKE
ncbi:MAG: hypothetical protein PHU85_11370 [Phycisphaerae bacterium]|nr:hypothetical protein [Phycisphaerae bacterium]